MISHEKSQLLPVRQQLAEPQRGIARIRCASVPRIPSPQSSYSHDQWKGARG